MLPFGPSKPDNINRILFHSSEFSDLLTSEKICSRTSARYLTEKKKRHVFQRPATRGRGSPGRGRRAARRSAASARCSRGARSRWTSVLVLGSAERLYTRLYTLQGSFSAAAAAVDRTVSKPNFARKYALESSRRDLHNAFLCTVL